MANNLQNLHSILEFHAKNQPNKTACVFLENDQAVDQYNYSQLYTKAKAIAAYLQRYNPQNERVLILLPQCLDYLAAFFGCLYAGAIAVPAYPPLRGNTIDRLEILAQDAQPTFVIAEADAIKILSEKSWASTNKFIDINEIDVNIADEYQAVNMSEIAFLQYSSGSTGNPKGVMISHNNILANLAMMKEVWKKNQSNVFVSWLPLFHDMGLISSAILPLCLGATLYLMSPSNFIRKPIRWLRAISNYQGNVSFAPDFAYKICAQISESEKNTLDLSSWHAAMNAAEPVRKETIEAFYNSFKDYGFHYEALNPAYGLAEATVFVSCGTLNQGPSYYSVEPNVLQTQTIIPAKPSSTNCINLAACGHSWLEEEIKIVNPHTLVECPPCTIGEIWISGPNVAKGYWNKDELNQQIFQAYTAQKKGPFLRSGDLGFLNEKKQLFITGRIKDLIIIHGKNYAAPDIEATAHKAHPMLSDIKNAIVAFSVENNNEEKLVLIIGIKPIYDEIDFNMIIKSIKQLIYDVHNIVPFDVLFVNKCAIPKTTSGKLQRHKVKENYLLKTLTLLALKIA